jgi:hypothetical protein
MVKESLEELAHPEYWDTRYSQPNEDEYDWLRKFDMIKPFLLKHLPESSKNSKILQLGCGNSVRMNSTFSTIPLNPFLAKKHSFSRDQFKIGH